MRKKYSPTQLCGLKAEKIACEYLQKHGLKLIIKNFSAPIGEIDLIMEDAKNLIFIEVRQRNRNALTSSAESIDWRKQRKIIKTAQLYLQKFPTQKFCRIDVIAILATEHLNEIHWIKDAFQVQ